MMNRVSASYPPSALPQSHCAEEIVPNQQNATCEQFRKQVICIDKTNETNDNLKHNIENDI